jgi:competence ComEA-like helix-hairpin-helix protein
VIRPNRPVRFRLWNRSDCMALAALLGAWGLALAAVTFGSVALGEPVRVDRGRVALVAEKIDPNTATVASLRRLPLIGAVKAEAIVHYRRQARPGRTDRPFRCREDLLQVPGVGPAAVERGATWLALPTRTAATAPS